ncbi:hypothetical protein FRC06_000599, partial [Ceratobasidium sp. 370]
TPSETASATSDIASNSPTDTVSVVPTNTATPTVSQSSVAQVTQTSGTVATVTQPGSSSRTFASTRLVTITSQRPTQLPMSTRVPDTTASTTIFIGITRSDGHVTSSAPLEITSFLATTASDGDVLTATVVIANPSGQLSPDGGGRGSSAFFRNKGAVAGVFLVVGIAGAAILLFLFFALRRRRRVKRDERDAAIAASLGPQSRVPFEDDDDDEPTTNSHNNVPMQQQNPFAYVAGTPHAIGQHGEYFARDTKRSYEPYDPYASYVPPPAASSSGHHHYQDSTAHTRIGSGQFDGYEYDYRHYQPPSVAAGVTDRRTSPTSPRRALSPTSGSSHAPTHAPGLSRGPSKNAVAGPSGQQQQRQRESVGAETASVYSVPEGSLIDNDDDDTRLDSGLLGMRLRGGVGSEQSLRDDEDYSRRVLTVTNAT